MTRGSDGQHVECIAEYIARCRADDAILGHRAESPGNGPFLVQESERRVRISGEPPVARSCRHQWHGTPRQWSWRFFLPTHTMTNSASRIVMVANRIVMCHPLRLDGPAGGVGGHQGQHGSAIRTVRTEPSTPSPARPTAMMLVCRTGSADTQWPRSGSLHCHSSFCPRSFSGSRSDGCGESCGCSSQPFSYPQRRSGDAADTAPLHAVTSAPGPVLRAWLIREVIDLGTRG